MQRIIAGKSEQTSTKFMKLLLKSKVRKARAFQDHFLVILGPILGSFLGQKLRKMASKNRLKNQSKTRKIFSAFLVPKSATSVPRGRQGGSFGVRGEG